MARVGRGILIGMVGMPAVLFIVMGLRWLLDPAGIAPSLGLSLETGLGLSTQVGDLAAFFLVLGSGISMPSYLVRYFGPGCQFR